MENYDIFIRTLLTDKVKLKPKNISSKLKDHILSYLKTKFEGVCSYHGYIRPESIEIFKFSMGYIQALSLNGDVEYTVNYYADVCNPSIGSIVHTKVVNTNKFGILAHTGIRDNDGRFLPILEIVVAKNLVNTQNDKNVDEFHIGDEIHVEIMGKKFELTDKKISAIARIIDTDHDKNILDNPVGIIPQDKNESDVDGDEEDSENTDQDEDDEEEEGDGEGEGEGENDAVDDSDEDDDEDDGDGSQFGGAASDGFFSDDFSASSGSGSDADLD